MDRIVDTDTDAGVDNNNSYHINWYIKQPHEGIDSGGWKNHRYSCKKSYFKRSEKKSKNKENGEKCNGYTGNLGFHQ